MFGVHKLVQFVARFHQIRRLRANTKCLTSPERRIVINALCVVKDFSREYDSRYVNTTQ